MRSTKLSRHESAGEAPKTNYLLEGAEGHCQNQNICAEKECQMGRRLRNVKFLACLTESEERNHGYIVFFNPLETIAKAHFGKGKTKGRGYGTKE